MCRLCSTDTDGSLPMPPATSRTNAGSESSASCTMSIAAFQHTARESESVNSPIASVSVASDRGSNRISA